MYMIVGGSHAAASINTLVVVAETSDSSPPMVPARPEALPASATTRSSGTRVRSTPSRVVSFSPGFAPADDDRFARNLVEIECVKGLTELEHHIVGHVDHVRYRADPGCAQPLPHPERGGCDLGSAEFAGHKAIAAAGILDSNHYLGWFSATWADRSAEACTERRSRPTVRGRSRSSTSHRAGLR